MARSAMVHPMDAEFKATSVPPLEYPAAPAMDADDPDLLQATIEAALRPGHFISGRENDDFVNGLLRAKEDIDLVANLNPSRAVRLIESFLAACIEKVKDVLEPGRGFSTVVAGLFESWIRAGQTAGPPAHDTAHHVLPHRGPGQVVAGGRGRRHGSGDDRPAIFAPLALDPAGAVGIRA